MSNVLASVMEEKSIREGIREEERRLRKVANGKVEELRENETGSGREKEKARTKRERESPTYFPR